MSWMAPLCGDQLMSRRRPVGDNAGAREEEEGERARRTVARMVAAAPDLTDAERPVVLAQTLRMLGLLAEETGE